MSREKKKKKKGLTLFQAAFIVMIIMAVAGTGYIIWKVTRENRQREAMRKLDTLVEKVDFYFFRQDQNNARLDQLTGEIDQIYEKVFDPEMKATVLALKGRLLARGRREKRAVEALKKAKNYNHSDYLVNIELAKTYYKLGEYRDAINSLNDAIAFLPKGARQERIDSYFIMGDSMEKLKDFGRAEWAYEQVASTVRQFAIEPLIKPEDIKDWSLLKENLAEKPSIWAKPLWDNLDDGARSAIESIEPGKVPEKPVRDRIVEGLNDLLRKNLYNRNLHEALRPYDSPNRATPQDIEAFSNKDDKMINRLVIDSSLPDVIRDSPITRSAWRYYILKKE